MRAPCRPGYAYCTYAYMRTGRKPHAGAMRARAHARTRPSWMHVPRQIFGFDVMLDAHLRPWILEVNLDPSLATDAPLDLRVKSAVLTDTLNLVGIPTDEQPSDEPVVAGAGCVGEVAGDAAAGASLAATGGSEGEAQTGQGVGRGLDVDEDKMVRIVDAELQRSRGGGWRRLCPATAGARRASRSGTLFEGSRARLNALPFQMA